MTHDPPPRTCIRKVRVPKQVFLGLSFLIQERFPMMARLAAIRELQRQGYAEAADWAHCHPDDYACGVLEGFFTDTGDA